MNYNDENDQGFYPQDTEQFIPGQEPPTGTPGEVPDQNNIPSQKVPPGHQYSVQTQQVPAQNGLFGIPWKWIAIGAVAYIVLKHV
jgi:hypothetical protein